VYLPDVHVAALAKKSRPLVIGYYLLKDSRARVRQLQGRAVVADVHTGGRPTPVDFAVAEAKKIQAAVVRHARLTTLEGLRVLEIGPGDDLGIAMLFALAGASEVVVCDRFAVRRDESRLTDLAKKLDLPPAYRPTIIDGVGAEDAATHFGSESFDLVYSVAVLEHVADLKSALSAVMTMLRPGGVTVHYVGGGDHGMFRSGGHHPLTYLTVPNFVYRAMTAHSGGPNRVHPADLRRIMEQEGPDYSLSLTQVMTQPFLAEPQSLPVHVEDYPDLLADVERIRHQLRQPFRSLPASELMVEGCLLVARSPLRSP
jgi:SAM-dependent methyltransferase